MTLSGVKWGLWLCTVGKKWWPLTVLNDMSQHCWWSPLFSLSVFFHFMSSNSPRVWTSKENIYMRSRIAREGMQQYPKQAVKASSLSPISLLPPFLLLPALFSCRACSILWRSLHYETECSDLQTPHGWNTSSPSHHSGIKRRKRESRKPAWGFSQFPTPGLRIYNFGRLWKAENDEREPGLYSSKSWHSLFISTIPCLSPYTVSK